METNIQMLKEMEAKLDLLSPEELAKLEADLDKAEGGRKMWYPNPGPQMTAFNHAADEIFYGGQAGGGKSDLIIGWAATEADRALILRRFNEDARDLYQRFISIKGNSDECNSSLMEWKPQAQPEKFLKFSGCKDEAGKERFKGKPFDFYAFDEIGDFTESMYKFITIWNRSATGKRCRIICTGNPPTTPEGLWVIYHWGPWLDPDHPNPAKAGEIRWFLRDPETDQEIEVEGRGPHRIGNESLEAKSRTFIPAKLSDNPAFDDGEYLRSLNSLPKELREAYRDGNFNMSVKSNPFQIIPSEWVRAAQRRWTRNPPVGVPMCNLAADVAEGGDDNNTIMSRHDDWFSEIELIPGAQTPTGTDLSALLIARRKDLAPISLDCGGGYGSTAYTKLLDQDMEANAFKGATVTENVTKDDLRIRFYNLRTEAYWRLREALDPDRPGGSTVALPRDKGLFQELTLPTYSVTSRGYKMEAKEKVIEKLGHSPDKADVCAICNYYGEHGLTRAEMVQAQAGYLPRDQRGDRTRSKQLRRRRPPVNPGVSARYSRARGRV